MTICRDLTGHNDALTDRDLNGHNGVLMSRDLTGRSNVVSAGTGLAGRRSAVIVGRDLTGRNAVGVTLMVGHVASIDLTGHVAVA